MKCFHNYKLKQNSGDAIFYKKCKTVYRDLKDLSKNSVAGGTSVIKKAAAGEMKNIFDKMSKGNYLNYKYGKSLCDMSSVVVDSWKIWRDSSGNKYSPDNSCSDLPLLSKNENDVEGRGQICLERNLTDIKKID
tara:strand:+ start:474 stop:875 length:402 start_codon:yes stop_codon:yes gene_type:complete